VVGVIGDPIAHSRSPLLHQAAFDALGLDWVSVAFRVAPEALKAALDGMRAFDIRGLSVTMPHKEAAARLVDALTPVAAQLGAVNCITAREGTLVGDSTDGAGFLRALDRDTGFAPAGRRCLVLGAGGAARAVIFALAEAGASEVVVVNRDAQRALQAAGLAGTRGRVGHAEEMAEAELIVQATPQGMAGTAGEGQLALDPQFLHPGQIVADLVYHPRITSTLAAAQERGATPIGGLGMLVHQAALALEQWTGRSVPVEALSSVVAEA
jgi:shikimate dehydrogenase